MALGHSFREWGRFAAGAVLLIASLAACAGTVREPNPAPAPDVLQQPHRNPSPGMVQEPATAIPPSQPNAAVPRAAPVPEPVYRETGVAGWYEKELRGRKTASGDVFDRKGLTAAHRTLPLGTVIRVTNLNNAKSIEVKIVDRGPFVEKRMLDLSYDAAGELGFLASGTAPVKIETLEPVHGTARYTVQAATYTEAESARLLKERLEAKFELVFIVRSEAPIARLFHVRIGSYASEERAGQIADKLVLEGLEPVVLRKD